MLAVAGIVWRGASFASGKYAETFSQARLFGAIFAGSSLITPFFFGTVAGAIASGRVPAGGYGDRVGSWINPTSLVGGCLAVTTCAFLAGVFLTADADRAGIHNLTNRLRRRTLAVGIVSGLIVFAGLYPVLQDSATLSHRLLGAALPLLVVAALAGAITLFLLYRRSYSMARFSAVAPVGAVIIGRGGGQDPWMLVNQPTLHHRSGAHTTL